MNDDDRLSKYLSDQADSLTLTPGDPSGVMRRGNRRRTRRRTALVGSVAVLGLVATSVIVRGGDDQKVKVGVAASPDVAASTFHWSVVKPGAGAGLGYSGAEAELSSGAVYSLSTAPGPADDKTFSTPATLYRTEDGTSWVKASLPSGLSPSELAAEGDTLYALGTAPAGGGGRDLVVASSKDGADTWSSITLPRDVADLEARHPGQISISTPTMAARDAEHQVATLVVSANLDPMKLRPELAGQNVTWEFTDTGLTVYQAPEPCRSDPKAPVSAVEAKDCRETAKDSIVRDANGNGPVIGSYTWSELGVDDELAGLVGGHTYTYVTDDGAHFSQATLPVDDQGWGSSLVAGADGYTLFYGASAKADSSTTVLHSADGHTWTKVTSFGGYPMSAGLLAGHPAVSVSGNDGSTTVQVQQADGTFAALDLGSAVTPLPGQKTWVGEVSFGPLGLAATVGSASEKDGVQGSWVVHSKDGRSLSVLTVGDVVTKPGSPIGLTVTADAIIVRLSDGSRSDQSTPPTQTVLVGTPG